MSVEEFQIESSAHYSYVTAKEADDFLAIDPTLSATWAAATDENKAIYLLAATRRIDLFDFIGERLSASQPLKFPRTGDSGLPDLPTDANRAAIFVPRDIELATALLAGTIATNPAASQISTGTQSANVSEVRAGSAVVKFATREGATQQAMPELRNETAFKLIASYLARPFLAGQSSPGTGNLDTPRDDRTII